MIRGLLVGLVLVICVVFGPGPADAAEPADAELSSREVFERRIMPIFRSPNPSSCVQCHLSGVDLKSYILPSHEKTFVSLRDQGLIDLDHPEKSRILKLIQMGEEQKSGAALIHQKVRQTEYEAFADWIKRSASDDRLRQLPPLKPGERAGPEQPAEVIRHARKDRLLASFENSIWAMRFRCMGCHTEGAPQAIKIADKHGEHTIWIKKGGPEATLAYLRQSKLINLDDPLKSLLLRKPLGEVKHGGGVKFQTGDQSYRAFRTFLEDYVRVMKGQYTDVASLPVTAGQPSRFGSEIWLKVADTPDAWGDHLMQVDVFAWDAAAQTWEKAPIATADRAVWGKGHLWQSTLTLLAAPGSERAERWKKGPPVLPPGKYLIRACLDGKDRFATSWQAAFEEGDQLGQAELRSAWPKGYGKMTVVGAGKLRK